MKDVLERGWDERTVTVDRAKLLETLKANREKHAREYRESLSGYKSLAMQRLEKLCQKSSDAVQDNFALIRSKIERFDPEDEDPIGDTVTLINTMQFRLEVPRNQSKSYDVAISMAEWEVGETIELTQSQFQCFVLDDWDWKERFTHLNKSYTGRG